MKRGVAVAAGLAFAVALQGCGTTFAYENVDRFVRWSVDDYVPLAPDQREFLDARVQAHLHWHRTRELPVYAATLRRFDAAVGDGLAAHELEWFEAELRRWGERLLDELLPTIAELLYSASPDQVARLARNLAKENERLLGPGLRRTPEQRRERWQREVAERFEYFLGRLNAEQRAIIRRLSLAYQPDEEPWLAYRVTWQHELIQLLTARPGYAEFAARLRELVDGREQWYGPEYAAIVAGNQAVLRELTQQVLGSLTDAQRARLSARLQGLSSDFEQLAARAEAPPPPLLCLVSCLELPLRSQSRTVGG